jgi:hypothetical protein
MRRRSMALLLAALLVLTPACGDVTEGLGGEGGGEQQENDGGGDGGGEQENEGGGEEGGD